MHSPAARSHEGLGESPEPSPDVAALRRSVALLEGSGRLRQGADRQALFALGHGEADARLGGGLKRAALHEVYAASDPDGVAAAGFAAALAARVAGTARAGCRASLVWIRHDLAACEWGEVFAPGLAEWGLDPDRLIIVKVAHAADTLKAANEALNCSALGAVIIESAGVPSVYDLTASRRLVLAAESGVTAIALRLGVKPKPSAAMTRWLVRAAPSHANLAGHIGRPRFDAALVRSRNGAQGRWIMEWDSDAYLFRDQRHAAGAAAAPSRPLPAASSHRPDQAGARLRHAG
jgi:protein ImuA